MAADNTARLNDIGTALRVVFYDEDENGNLNILPIDDATLLEIVLQKPDDAETVVVKTAVVVTDGLDGQAQYMTVDGDLNVEGKWLLEGFVRKPSGEWHTDITEFTVGPVIPRPVV